MTFIWTASCKGLHQKQKLLQILGVASFFFDKRGAQISWIEIEPRNWGSDGPEAETHVHLLSWRQINQCLFVLCGKNLELNFLNNTSQRRHHFISMLPHLHMLLIRSWHVFIIPCQSVISLSWCNAHQCFLFDKFSMVFFFFFKQFLNA